MDLSDNLAGVYQDNSSDTAPTAGSGSQGAPKPGHDRVAEYMKSLPKSGITLFSHRSAPNGFKVAVVLSELGLDYHTFNVDLARHEERLPGYVELNPNARIPAIIDHDNNNFTLWESGAIIEYICKRPQTLERSPSLAKQLIGGDSLQVQAQINAWVYFQASGHAPIIGHALQFRYIEGTSPAPGISLVAERFLAEAKRVAGVLEVYLAEKREQLTQDMDDDDDEFLTRPVWLVGDSITLADLAFIPWNHILTQLGIDLMGDFPEVFDWTQRIVSRPKVKEALSGIREKP